MNAKTTFNALNLSKEEQEIRALGIEALFLSTSKTNVGFTREDAVKVYDKMQQHLLDEGLSEWKFYQQKKGA